MTNDLAALPAWDALKAHAATLREVHLRTLFAEDPDRFARLSFAFGPLLADYSKNRVTAETLGLLTELAHARNVESARAAMFAGERINCTENRAVLHTALRNRDPASVVPVDGADVMPEVRRLAGKRPAL